VSALESAACISRVKVQVFLHVSRVSGDASQCHVGKDGSWMCGFDKA
jgi:hypothetical protein